MLKALLSGFGLICLSGIGAVAGGMIGVQSIDLQYYKARETASSFELSASTIRNEVVTKSATGAVSVPLIALGAIGLVNELMTQRERQQSRKLLDLARQESLKTSTELGLDVEQMVGLTAALNRVLKK